MKTLNTTQLKKELKKLDETLTIELKNIRINGELRGTNGFISNNSGNIVYVNTESIREDNPLYRNAKHAKDYTGGRNRFTDFISLPYKIVALLEGSDRT